MSQAQDAAPAERSRRPRRGDVATAPRTAGVWDAVQQGVQQLRSRTGRDRLDVLDLGGGTGGLAVALAAQGHQVLVVDPSPDALAALERRAEESGVADRVRSVQADAATLADVVGAADADLVCCHEVLEHVDDPADALAEVVRAVRPGGIVSLLVAQRSATVVARALAGRFVEAAQALDDPSGRWGPADPLPRRFDVAALGDLVASAGLVVRHLHGVRLFSDLVPEVLLEGDDSRTALLELERRAGAGDSGLVALATQLHVLAERQP
ncbi:MAG TPA: methyltransferase domain-containing protein [Actinomycetales bacterium]|nr:methyltransferase domain-containing protein [Actinomycetales bacterium]